MTKKRLNLKEWADEDKPREKMLKKGIAALSDGELLAILFRTGTKEETAVELARRVLNSVHNNLDELSKIPFEIDDNSLPFFKFLSRFFRLGL